MGQEDMIEKGIQKEHQSMIQDLLTQQSPKDAADLTDLSLNIIMKKHY